MGKRFNSGQSLFDCLIGMLGIERGAASWRAMDQLFVIEGADGNVLFRRQFRVHCGFNRLREDAS
jgi:hypothetical protein